MRKPSVVFHEEDLRPTIETEVTILGASHLRRCESMAETSDSKIRTKVLGHVERLEIDIVINAGTHRMRTAPLKESLSIPVLIIRKDSVYDRNIEAPDMENEGAYEVSDVKFEPIVVATLTVQVKHARVHEARLAHTP